MDDQLRSLVCNATGATAISDTEVIQTLWSGYGQILRVSLVGGDVDSVILKHVTPPSQSNHPRGWSTDRSHQRKLRSYQVEAIWYRDWSDRCNQASRVPACRLIDQTEGRSVFVLEDLDAAGFSERRGNLPIDSVKVCLAWLASFHATFLGESPVGLWPVGTYWHLDTRPDEWGVMQQGPLKSAASNIDAALENCPYQTLVHGDAKVANFCFTPDDRHVAAVDFQYVGGGCGMKDVAYFLGSCLGEEDCQRYEAELLDKYFGCLTQTIQRLSEKGSDPQKDGKRIDAAKVEESWREMYPVAWADFNRFLLGWCPGHHKLTGYSQKITQQVIDSLR